MSTPRAIFFCGLLAPLLVGLPLFGQTTPDIAPTSEKAADRVFPPVPPPPIDFRKLLAMKAPEREKILATRTQQQRDVLIEKLREYEALPAPEREARLCSLQLRLTLRPLLELPGSNRTERLMAISSSDRKLVEERLRFWDELPTESQREFLTNEWVLRFIFRPETALPNRTVKMPDASRERIEKGIDDWNRLPDPKRQEILNNFKRMFELSEKEKAKVLNEFSDDERQRMQKTLQTFARLPKPQRERCVNGFQKFAGLSAEERQQFLKNVEIWESMSVKDRIAWRTLVTRISSPKPPSPQGLNLPPLPAAPNPKLPPIATTNSGPGFGN